jgi:hypothetical protein
MDVVERFTVNSAAQKVLASFDALPRDEQQEVAHCILLRMGRCESPPLDDEALNRLAVDLFVALDREEAGGL